MQKGLTIVICTYNGSQRLAQTVSHIATQITHNLNWEVILADNGSTDNSIAVATTVWNSFGLEGVPFRILQESTPGKLFALQSAIQMAANEYIIICDDDNWLNPDYVQKAYTILETMPEVAAAGGLGFPITDDESGLPDWFYKYEYAYAVGPQSKTTGFLKPRDILWGAGLVTRRSLYLKMYKRFPSFLLESKINVLSAEDTEYCLRLLLKDYRLYYDETLIYKHFIPSFKLNPTFRDQKLIMGFKNSDVILRKYYAAMRAILKTKGKPHVRIGLLLISPINYLFSFSAKRAEKAKNTLFHLLPFNIPTDSISRRIKAFILED